MDIHRLLAESTSFREKLYNLKKQHKLGSRDWYPYDALANLQHLSYMLSVSGAVLPELTRIADIGAADGDMAFYLATRGYSVDIYDFAPTNYNGLRGAQQMRIALDLPVNIYDVDLDRNPESIGSYDLIFFLGILYHLKNPYGALETLATRARYVFLSTKTAKTFAEGLHVDHTPSAYLLAPRETNNDHTNYWVFTRAGLELLIDRTGFEIQGYITGDDQDSHPSKKDERSFALLRSRHFS